MVHIQEELVALAADRRLIPFIGAGFSASLGLPSWESMLREVSKTTESPVDFDAVMESTHGDLLQVAEYYYLQHDRQIGPIRREIERAFSSKEPDPLVSDAHIELANLGANQIYTTNYDDILEQTQRRLGLPFTQVILPKDVALANPDTTQIVKYHGDLAHERTLVLTESAYYKRLDFESPMDLKFRSDLLGKSVLFMGYSFRDVNVRIIWFKLMDMMRDIPEADRRPSYIVRFEPDAALEKLYAAVGLKTVVLAPRGGADTDEEKSRLLADFLLSLSARAQTSSRRSLSDGGHESVNFVSAALLSVVDESTADTPVRFSSTYNRRFRFVGLSEALTRRMFEAVVPPNLQQKWERSLRNLLSATRFDATVSDALKRVGDPKIVGRYLVWLLAQTGDPEARVEKLLALADDSIDWGKAWRAKLSPSELDELLATFAAEIRYQARSDADEDIAYLALLVSHISRGRLIDTEAEFPEGTSPGTVRTEALQLLAEAARIYPSIKAIDPDAADQPNLESMLAEIKAREANFAPIEVDMYKLLSVNNPSRARAVHVNPRGRGKKP